MLTNSKIHCPLPSQKSLHFTRLCSCSLRLYIILGLNEADFLYFLLQIINRKMSEEATLIEEKDYCDESELMIQEYSNLRVVQFEEELEHIGNWLGDQSQSSMLITGEAASGKKTLLYELIQQGRQRHPDWLFSCHFASMTPVYSHILYRTMIELRNHFKVEQKVDLNEEKLRRYFKYWLEVISDYLEKEYLGYNRKEVPKVVIILEGVDLCVDSKGNYVEPQFWLPAQMPPHIKLILTTKNNNCYIRNSIALRHQLTKQKRDRVVHSYSQKVQQLSRSHQELPLYSLNAVNEMLARGEFKIEGINFEEILGGYIRQVALPELSEEVIRSLLYTLILTRKGLRSRELAKIVNVGTDKWAYFFRYFSFLIVESKGYFIICNLAARKAIQKIVDPRKEKTKLYRGSIVGVLKKEGTHLRGLQQMVSHLLLSEDFTELKQIICRIEHFLMLYTPFSKQLLCQCWNRLEQLEQFDPVFEYNKAIESYTSQYYPKEEDLYKIIFQISLFFKEYAEFQNSKTPKFRHPLIKGEADNLEAIGIFEELSGLDMVGKCKNYKLKPVEKVEVSRVTRQEPGLSKLDGREEKGHKNDMSRSRKDPLGKKSIVNLKHQGQAARTISVKSKRSEKKVSKIVDDANEMTTPSSSQLTNQDTELVEATRGCNIEELNVGILSNQQKFKAHFLGEMKEYVEDYIVPFKENSYKEKSLVFESEESQNEEQSLKERNGGQRQYRIDVQRIKGSYILKSFKEYLEQSYHKTGEEVQFYYYKQWIWLQFPWLCQTVRHVYSAMLKECLPGSIHFMSPQREFRLIRDVLKIARCAKDNKNGVLSKKIIQIHSIKSPTERHLALSKNGENYGRQEPNARLTGIPTAQQLKTTESCYGYKVDLNNIDDCIIRERIEESRIRDKCSNERRLIKGDCSLPNLFVTEASNKESRMFPVLHKSKFAFQASRKRKEKENNQDTRDYTIIIRKYNQLKHDNEMLVQKIEESKRLEMLSNDKGKEDLGALTQHLHDLEGKKESLEKNHKNQVELRKKLDVIIKICDLNKMYGSETDFLSNYLDSLKKMIDIEQSRVREIKDSLQNKVDNSKIVIKELKSRKKELKSLKESTLIPYTSLCTDETNQYAGRLGLEEIEEQLKEMTMSVKQKSSKRPRTRERHQLSPKDYDVLQLEIGVVYGEEGNEEKVKQFAGKFQKLRELRLKNVDLKRQYEQAKTNNKQMRYEKKILLEGDTRDRQIETASLLVEKRKELGQIRNRNSLLSQAISTLKTKECSGL